MQMNIHFIHLRLKITLRMAGFCLSVFLRPGQSNLVNKNIISAKESNRED